MSRDPDWFGRGTKSLLTSCILLTVVGCASAPKPEGQLAAAETAVQAAQSKEAERHAPVPMDRAKDKLNKARAAADREDYATARRLAEEAQADAELANALADQAQAQKAVEELDASIQVLREEMERASKR